MIDLSNKIALISGASSGLGASHARAIVECGGKVVLGDLNNIAGQALADDLGDNAIYTPLDVTQLKDWQLAVELAKKHFGGLNVLINNAGIISFGALGEYSQTDFEKVMTVNCTGTFLGMSAAVETLKLCAPSSIINISSIAGLVGSAGVHAYVASKFAIRGLTKSAAMELGEFNIRVNSIHPGIVKTPFTEAIPESFALNVFKRFGRKDEVSNMVLYLASDLSSFSTGAEFIVDGGETAGKEQPENF